MAGLAGMIAQNLVLSSQTVQHTPRHEDLLVKMHSRCVGLARRTILKSGAVTQGTSSITRLAVSCKCIRIKTVGTDSETAIGGPEKEKSHGAHERFSAIDGSDRAGDALDAAELAFVGEPCPNELTSRTYCRTNAVTYGEIVVCG